MRLFAAFWESFRREFFPRARRARLPRTRPSEEPLFARVRGLVSLWRDWLVKRAWLHLDHPPLSRNSATPVSGTLEVCGWAVAVDGVAAVTVTCGGVSFGAAALGVRRRDLARRFPHIRRASRGGFYVALDTRALPDGRYEFAVTARTRTGQKVRVYRRLSVKNAVGTYERWRGQTSPNAAALAWMRRNVRFLPFRPTVSLLLPVRGERQLAALARTLDAVDLQVYPHWQVVLACADGLRPSVTRLTAHRPDDRVRLLTGKYAGDADARNTALRLSSGELFAPLDAGDVPTPECLFEIVYQFNRSPEAGLVYADEESAGRPVFKPAWSPHFFLGTNYVGRPWAARRELVEGGEDFDSAYDAATEYDLLLRLTERSRAVGHVPRVLLRRPAPAEADERGARMAVTAALRRRGCEGAIASVAAAGTLRIYRGAQAGQPPVTVLVAGTAAEVRGLLDSMARRTSYRDYEVRPVGENGPGLAERLNKSADAARGEYLLFVRAAAVLADDWIEALLDAAACPGVGVVGGHLRDDVGRIVDAGIVLAEDDRILFPVRQSREPDDPGTLQYLAAARECSAISRDCLMVRRDLFLDVGGYDERLDGWLLEADFCLHARARGYAIVSTPFARLRAAGPPAPPSPAAAEVYRARWAAAHGRGDPYFSPNFSRRREGFRVNDEPTLLTHAPSPLIDRDSVRRVVALKLDHVGDVALSLPAVRRLRELFPEAELTMLVGPHARAIVEHEPAVDRVLAYEFYYADSHRTHRRLTDADRAELRVWLGGFGFDLAVDLRRETDSRELTRLSGARWTAGFADLGEAEWLTVRLPCEGNVRPLQPGRHASQDMLRLVDMVAQAASDVPLSPPPASADDWAKIGELLADVVPAGHRLLIAIHPGSGRAIKCWPAAYFGRLAGMFTEQLGAAVIVLGGPGEERLAAEAICHAPPGAPVASLAGLLNLEQLAAAIRHCDLFVGNDSGPTHLAATTGVPVLAVFAGTADPLQWGPLGPGAASLHRALLCSPCYITWPRDCQLRLACTLHLHPESVFEAAVRVLLPRWSKFASGVNGEREREYAKRSQFPSSDDKLAAPSR
jgi:ADP-heptose:LPS heptosyltransferase